MLTMREKRILACTTAKRYFKATKKEKGTILDELVANTGYNRSYARRLLAQLRFVSVKQLKQQTLIRRLAKKDRQGQNKQRVYGQQVVAALAELYSIMDGICAK